jgi:hypothetical protein
MRLPAFVSSLIVCSSLLVAAQTPAPATSVQPAESTPLPVRRVVLYKTGVGYFEHLGTVRDRQDVAIRFTSAQLNDVLKSLTTIDLGKGRVAGISYNSIAPIEQRLGALRLPVGLATTAFDLLGSLRGARVEVTSGTGVVEGRLLSVERRNQLLKDTPTAVESFSILTDLGEMRSFDLTPAVRVRIVDRDLRQEVGRYLDVVGSSREQDVRRMVISSAGSGERQLFVSYISEVPIWKSTYRLVIPEKGKPLLQGWAIVDNTIGEDWSNVELSLVAGAPQSFIQQISQPYYGRRPTVPLPQATQITPQTHQATLTTGMGRVAGRVLDPGGGAVPGASVALSGPSGTRNTVTNGNGEYAIDAPPGQYSLAFELQGFSSQRVTVALTAGGSTAHDATLSVGGVSETVTVSSEAASRTRDSVMRRERGVAGGLPGPPPPPAAPMPAYDQLRGVEANAQAGELGDLFEYRIKEPVTLRKNQSALVPIVSTEVSAEKVVLWNRSSGSGRALRALWLSNSTGYTLDGGSVAIIDGNAFAGEGLVEPLKAGERRLISYAAELGVLVNAKQDTTSGRVTRLRVANGVVVHEMEERAAWTYSARNANAAPVTLLIEHRTRPGWTVMADIPPAETTPDTQRFRLALDPGKETTLTVREARPTQTSISVAELTEQYIASGMRQGMFADELLRALKPVIDKRVELAGVERHVVALTSQQDAITSDQQRLRENMKALRGSSEEKQLLQRYTRQLNDQEDKLEELRKTLAQASAQQTRLEGELGALIEKLSFEGTGKL